MKLSQKDALRVVDANINRCKEGLRVIEDVFRFIVPDDGIRRKARKARHDLDTVIPRTFIQQAIVYRDAARDTGRKVDCCELRRASVKDIVYANFQRVKEALRVLEEFFKIIYPNKVAAIKRLRYNIYQIEKKGILFFCAETVS